MEEVNRYQTKILYMVLMNVLYRLNMTAGGERIIIYIITNVSESNSFFEIMLCIPRV